MSTTLHHSSTVVALAPLAESTTAVTAQAADEILAYAQDFGQPMVPAFATQISLELRDRGLLVD
jgi:hypothetical protein